MAFVLGGIALCVESKIPLDFSHGFFSDMVWVSLGGTGWIFYKTGTTGIHFSLWV